MSSRAAGRVRGQRPKPAYLKLIQGKRPINGAEPKPTVRLPEPPEELSDDARLEWDRVAPELYDLGVMTAIDRATLAAYCVSYGRWQAAERAMAEMAKRDPVTSGLLVKSANTGNAVTNPLLWVATRAMADTVRYAAEFGMTPSARSRIRADQSMVRAQDPAAKYFD